MGTRTRTRAPAMPTYVRTTVAMEQKGPRTYTATVKTGNVVLDSITDTVPAHPTRTNYVSLSKNKTAIINGEYHYQSLDGLSHLVNGTIRCVSFSRLGDVGTLSPSDPFTAQQKLGVKSAAVLNCKESFSPSISAWETIANINEFTTLFKSAFSPLVSNLMRIPKGLPLKASPAEMRKWYKETKKRGIPKSHARKYFRAASKDYLNVSFGWAPMLADIESAVGLTAKFRDREIRRFDAIRTTHGTSRLVLQSTKTVTVGSTSTALAGPVTLTHDISQVLKGRYTMKWRYDNSYLVQYRSKVLQTAYELSLTSVFSSIWACVPFSWVVNWVIPIDRLMGEIDRALVMYPFINIIDESYSETVTLTYQNGRPTTYVESGFTCVSSKTRPMVCRIYTRNRADGLFYNANLWLKPAPGLSFKRSSYLLAVAGSRLR